MRIAPALLFRSQTPSSTALAEAEALLAKHGVNPTESTTHNVAVLFHCPAAWHFEHDGWLIGGLGGFPGLPRGTGNFHFSDEVFVCKDGVGAQIHPSFLQEAVKSMNTDGSTDLALFIERLTAGLTPRQFMEGFSSASGRQGPYQTRFGAGEEMRLNYFSPAEILMDLDSYPQADAFLKRTQQLSLDALLFDHNDGVECYQLITNNDDQPSERSAVQKDLQQWLFAQAHPTRQALIEALNQPAYQAARSAHSNGLRLAAWAALGNSPRRIQALEAHPGTLGGLVLFYWKKQSKRAPNKRLGAKKSDPQWAQLRAQDLAYWALLRSGMAELGRLIDAGQPWYAHAAQWLTQAHHAAGFYVDARYTQELMRGLQRTPRLPADRRPTLRTLSCVADLEPHSYSVLCTTLSTPSASPAATLIWLLGVLEMADVPASNDQWAALRETLASPLNMDRHTEQNGLDPRQHPTKTSLAQGRNYRHFMKGLAQAPQGMDWLLPYEVLVDVGEAGMEVTHWVKEAHNAPDPWTWSVLKEHWTAKQWLEASAALHRLHQHATARQAANKAKAMAAFHAQPGEGLWEAGGGLPAQASREGVAIRALLHPWALLKEGEDMGHCVAGYSYACFQGRSRIYSLTDTHTGERATLEVGFSVVVEPYRSNPQAGMATRRPSFAYPQQQLVQIQLRGPHNQAVSDRLHQAAKGLIAAANANPDLERWQVMDVPDEWQGQSGVDDRFYEQVREWLGQAYPRIASQLPIRTAGPAEH